MRQTTLSGVLAVCLLAVFSFTNVEANNGNSNSYDFIIVGGGAAGCVVARRLSDARPSWRILVIEAGGDYSTDPRVISGSTLLYESNFSWNDFLQKSSSSNAPFAAGYANSARVLGGGSEVNGMAYQRGSPDTYNTWATILGDNSWSYDNLVPYFKRAENSNLANATNGRGRFGPLPVTTGVVGPFQSTFNDAGTALGYPLVADINDVSGNTLYGFSMEQHTKNSAGQRVGTYEGYLKPIANRNTVTVLARATATSIIFQHNKAKGVNYILNGESNTAYARREVILSAGPLRTPQLLTLSGVADYNVINQLNAGSNNIPKVSNLPAVGKNLQDIPMVIMSFNHNINPVPQNTPAVFLNNAEGPSGQYADNLLSWQFGNGYVLVKFFLLRNSLNGSITINSADPLDKPFINLDYWSNDALIQSVVDGIKRTREIANQIGGFVETSPGASVVSDADLASWVYNNIVNAGHFASSVSMGTSSDNKYSVLNSALQVKGVRNLRVIDTSVMPIITSGTTYNGAVLIGEKGAQLVINDNI